MEVVSKSFIFNIPIRVYGAGEQVSLSHGYLVNDLHSGTSNILGNITINVETITFIQLRDLLEYDSTNNMKKRSMLFQEILFIMQRLPNIYNKPISECYKYVFGYAKKNMNEVKLLDVSLEHECIINLVRNIYDCDLIIIPLSQLPTLPDDTIHDTK
jgi:hypothetical protein